DNGTDSTFPQLVGNSFVNISDFLLLEVVQSTFDFRLKRFITLVPPPTNNNATGGPVAGAANQLSTPLFFQPGMSSLFLPIMAAFQHVDHSLFVALDVGEALYNSNVEAP